MWSSTRPSEPVFHELPVASLGRRHRPGIRMALLINDLCVNCDVCAPVCPNAAITQGETIYVIEPRRCTECVGHYDEPQCVAVCPVECIELDPAHAETPEHLLAKFHALSTEDVK